MKVSDITCEPLNGWGTLSERKVEITSKKSGAWDRVNMSSFQFLFKTSYKGLC